MSFIDFDICHRMTLERMLCAITLAFSFKVKHFIVMNLQ